jgi:hypothetical protein
MLHKDPAVISPETFALTQQLQSFKELNGFYLVGGTALALQLGHRNSIDIDLFSQTDFDYELLTAFLKSKFFFEEAFVRKNTIIGFINKIKVDFIKHPYQYVLPPITEERITFLSKEDIAAMKLNAIVGSGQRLKDFIDVYFLLEYFSVEDMLGFYEKKYTNTNLLIALKALSYFDDINEAVEPPKLLKPLPVKQIKQRISKAVMQTNKIFKSRE